MPQTLYKVLVKTFLTNNYGSSKWKVYNIYNFMHGTLLKIFFLQFLLFQVNVSALQRLHIQILHQIYDPFGKILCFDAKLYT